MGESAQARVHQLVLECLQKAAGVVLQARGARPQRAHSADRNWFPLSVESVDFVRQYLEPWATNLHEPLQLDIVDEEGALVERWTMHYSPKTESVRERASTISRKIGILLRTLYSYVRILPAYQGAKKQHARTNYQFRIYNPSLKLEFTNQEFAHSEIGQYSFPLMKTPYGQLHLKSKYLLDPSGRLSETPAVPMEPNVVINDYIPDYHGASRFTVADASHRRTRSTSIDSSAQPAYGVRIPQPSSQRLSPVDERQMKRAATVGPSTFAALTRRHSSPSPPVLDVLDEEGSAAAAMQQPSGSAPSATAMDNIPTMSLGIVGKSRSASRASPKDLPFLESSPSMVSALPDPAEALFSCSPPFPQLDCTLLSTSPQLPAGLSGRHMTKYLQAAVANQHRQQQAKQPMIPHSSLGASQSRRRTVSDTPPTLDFNIPVLPDDPFDQTPHHGNLIQQKDDDPTGQLPFAPEDFEPEDDDENQAGFLEYWDNGPFAQSMGQSAGSGLPGLWPLPERNRPRSFRKINNADSAVIEEQMEEFRTFKDSFYQAN